METIEEEFSNKCSIAQDTDDIIFDTDLPEAASELPDDHSHDDERQYLYNMIKTVDIWKAKLKKNNPDNTWKKFLFTQNEKMKMYQKYILFEGDNDTYSNLPNNLRKEITKVGKIIKLTRIKICSSVIEPKTVLIYLKKVYTYLSSLVDQIELKEESSDKQISMVIQKIKTI